MNAQLLSPNMLGFWTRSVRITANMSQEALAATSGLTVRTVQRVESGERASLTTRRCLARGLGYENPDTFDDPAFVETVISILDEIRTSRVKAEEERYPEHLKLEVAPVTGGAAFANLIHCCDAWVFHCDETAPPEAQAAAAFLFDTLQDYSDIWSDITHSGRLEAQGEFERLLAELEAHGVRAYHGHRATRLVGEGWLDERPLSWAIAYVTVVPAAQLISQLIVPKCSLSA